MPELLYFDCNTTFGPYPQKHKEARWTKEHLLDDLVLAGIAGALVYHRLGRHYDPMLGNMRLIEEIRDDRDRLFPCWFAMPSFGPEFATVAEFTELMKQHDVRAVRIEAKAFGVPPRERVWGELPDALLENDILCVLPSPGYGAELDFADPLLTIFRENKTLLMNHVWSQWRELVALMEEHPNLHIEFSNFQANRAVEFFAKRFGAERCLFGTGLPDKAPGAARGFLDFTLLPHDQAQLIAGENLRRLLGGQGPTSIPQPGEWHDSITEAVRNGKPVPCLALDAHCHIVHDGGHTVGERIVTVKGDADGMLELTRRAGIDKTAIMSWVAPLSMDTDLGNEIVEKSVRRYPEEFIGLLTINPEYDDEAKIEALIQKYHVELGFPGLKTFTPCQAIDYDDPLFEKWFQYANDHHLYLVLDPKGGEGADRCVRNLASRYPDMTIYIDHCGRSWQFAKWVVAVMRDHPNIWAQLNFTLVTNGLIEYLVEQVSADRVLFGTDAPMRDPRPQVTWLVFTRLPEEDKRRIFGENFAGILRRAKVEI
ncbi:MAG: amidohydrolase family protein [Armatimonadetes bacterium]|nr:amidohydrolase family protein [Armatimonadota bacterium]